ncbi:MAG: excinuclease ABC subunit UvrC [Thermodesulfobacteriota bacterium]|nr:excinuclease ABC subunit UvrC [Thermodesulfobacteriota bacterium]
MTEEIEKKLAALPSSPGVYLMRDAKGRVLYVGKARHLKRRVTSYFRKAAGKNLKTRVLMDKTAGVDTIVTHTEKEALLLESNLIKKHRPRYNVILKDDKRYPCLRLDVRNPYPNLTVVRKPKKDGALYFGPFASAGAVRKTLKWIHRTFKLRKCKGNSPQQRERPCLNFQMGLCLGPCSLPVNPHRYEAEVQKVVLFLKGRMPELVKSVKDEMEGAAARQEFEEAAAHRDRLFALEKTLEKQVAFSADFKDRDVVGMARQNHNALMMALFVRQGFFMGSRPFFLPETLASDKELISSFVKQYYGNAPFIPKEVLLPTEPEDGVLLEEWLGEMKGERVYIMTPQRGEKARLLEMAVQNAEKSLAEHLSAPVVEEGMGNRIQKRLGLKSCPERIECFDLSNIAGTGAVGAMVVFERGRNAPQKYRRYRIKKAVEADDYAMLREVLTRRYGPGKAGTSLPDLLMVDGGKGHLNVAESVLRGLGLHGSFDLISIAKKSMEHGETEDKIYRPGRKNPVNFRRDPTALLFLQRIRDEAHRYVITYHRKRRLMTYRRSALEGIPGIGPKRRSQLLRHFGSMKGIRAASVEELRAVSGMTAPAAQSLFEALRKSGQLKT